MHKNEKEAKEKVGSCAPLYIYFHVLCELLVNFTVSISKRIATLELLLNKRNTKFHVGCIELIIIVAIACDLFQHLHLAANLPEIKKPIHKYSFLLLTKTWCVLFFALGRERGHLHMLGRWTRVLKREKEALP